MPPNPLDAVLPWLVFGVVIALLLRVQKAIQYRIFGLGWMFSAQHETAAVIYTLVLLPGIIVHEAAEWVVAGVLGYPTKTSMHWPEADNNGELDPKFVTVDYGKLPKTANTAQKLKDLFRKSAVEIAPTIVGIGLTLLISMSILRLDVLLREIPSWDVLKIGDALGKVTSQPEFPLWFYILFTVSNSMMPRRFARHGIAILAGVAVMFMLMLAVIGFSSAVTNWLNGPIPNGVNQLSAIFGLVLAVDGVVFGGLIVAEALIERVTQRKAPYKTAAERALAMRKAVPKPAPKPITSIYEYLVPLPSIPDVMGIRVKAAPKELPKPDEKPAIPAPVARPAVAAPIAKPELPKPEERPALPSNQPAFGNTGRGLPAATTSRPAEPEKTGDLTRPMSPATPAASSSPFGAPKASPAATSATPSKPADPVAKPAFGGSPATPFGSPKPTQATPPAASAKPSESEKSDKPAAPAFGGARPGVPPPAGRPALPAGSTSANPPVPAVRQGMPAPPVPGTKPPANPFGGARPNATNPARRDDDIIDAEVIDEDDDEPTFMRGVPKTNPPPPTSKPSFGARPNSPFSPPSKPFSAPPPKRNQPDHADEAGEDVHYDDVDDPA